MNRSPLKINIGPGKGWSRPGWTTVDFYDTTADIVCDLRQAQELPLPSHAASIIFCSHVIEHLDDVAVQALFREAFRILQYQGTFRVSCPDAAKAVAQFKKGNCDPQREVVTSAAANAASHLRLLNVLASFRARRYRGKRNTPKGYSGGPFATKAEVLAHVENDSLEELSRWAVSLIPDDASYRAHINAHWPEKVMNMLREAGFRTVYPTKFGKSRASELRDEAFDNRPGISLFVEARASGLLKRIQSRLARLLRVFHIMRHQPSSTIDGRRSSR